MSSVANGRSAFVLAALLLFLSLVGLGACDQFNGLSGEAEEGGGTSSFTLGSAPVSESQTVLLLPMSPEDQLRPPGTTPKIDLNSFKHRGGGVSDPPQTAVRGSHYGCVMSSPNPGGKSPYRYKAVYAFFSGPIIEKAGGGDWHRRFMVARARQSEKPASNAQVLRKARCRIPASVKAKRLIQERLAQIGGLPSSWKGQTIEIKSRSGSSGRPQAKKTCGPNEEKRYDYDCSTTCVVWKGERDCNTVCETTAVCVEKDYDGDGGGEGLTGGGPGSCNYEGGTSDQLCDTPYPTSPSSDTIIVRDDKRCGGDPLKDMEIRATGCGEDASIEGGRYGYTRGPNNNQFHAGIDLLNDEGDPVEAAEGGTVYSVGVETDDEGEVDGWGRYVIIRTENDEFHLYAHLQDQGRVNELNEDDNAVTVEAGDEIGQTGISGNSDDDCSGGPPHLHYEIRQGDSWNSAEPVDPENHLGTQFNSNGEVTSDSC